MPFPWKKTSRGSRFSQFVADHINSPKRGGSLVVETGFPTSLVDLFVKNRDRMRKFPKKKRSTRAHDPVTPSPCSSPSPLRPLNAPDSVPPPGSPTRPATNSPTEKDAEKGISFRGRDTGTRIEEAIEKGRQVPIVPSYAFVGCKNNDVFGSMMFVLMIVVGVGLALGTKRFVIAITMSAFLLFFLEFVGKGVYRRFRPSSDNRRKIKSVVEKFPCLDGIKLENDEVSICSGCSNQSPEIEIAKSESRSLPQRISSCEESGNAGVDNEGLGSERDEKLVSKKGGLEKQEEYGCDIPEFKHRHSRQARVKSKMKKLVPKKLRKSKKTNSNSESEVSGSMDNLDTCEERKLCNNVELECQEQEVVLSTEQQCGETKHAIEFSKGSSFVVLGAGIVEEEMGRQGRCHSGYSVLCLIVLFGLVGGRIVALGLALSWFLILKLLGRSRKVPMVRSSLD